MKIAIVFPTNRYVRWGKKRKGKVPDNVLFGVNQLHPRTRVEIISVSPTLERFINLCFGFLAWPFQSQFTRLNLGRALLALSAMRNADVVVSCVDSMNRAVLLLKKLRFFRSPVICMAGNVMDGTERFPTLHQWLWSGANRVITHAPVDQEKLARMGLGNRGIMIPVGSDEQFYRSSKERVDDRLIASIGSDRDRDYETLYLVTQKLLDIRFEIHASSGNTFSSPIPPNVRVVTDASPLQSRALLARSSVVVIPLRETFRAAGQLALIDALLMKKPVVISATRGIVEPYNLSHGESVLLVAPENINALARAIKTLHRDPTLRRKLGEQGRQLALRYTTTRYAEKLRRVIDDVLKTTVGSAS